MLPLICRVTQAILYVSSSIVLVAQVAQSLLNICKRQFFHHLLPEYIGDPITLSSIDKRDLPLNAISNFSSHNLARNTYGCILQSSINCP